MVRGVACGVALGVALGVAFGVGLDVVAGRTGAAAGVERDDGVGRAELAVGGGTWAMRWEIRRER